MDLEVEMYARIINTLEEYVEIIRIKENYELDNFIIDENGRQYSTVEILKASHSIIDLIEVGDYVNGFKIIRRFVNIHNGKKLLIALEKEEGYEYSNNLNDYMGDDSIHIYDEDIKTIVTKEQFESMSYKVKE